MKSVEFRSIKYKFKREKRNVFSPNGHPNQVWHMVEVMKSDFNYHLFMQKPFTDKYFWSSHLIQEVDEHVRMIYPEIPNSG